jgi:magnesium chelatase family protein
MVAQINTVTFHGIEVVDVNVQAHFSPGMPAFSLVGLPDKTIAESRERIRAALHSIGLMLPSQRIIVNLSPADLVKEGSHFDLPITIALLINMGVLKPEEVQGYLILGELALDGSIIGINGALPAAIGANHRNLGLICPAVNGSEAAWSGNNNIIAANNIVQLINHLKERQTIAQPKIHENDFQTNHLLDLKDIKGQETAKRALEIAAIGGHNILMSGPPGAGKSMLASRMPSILPQMSASEILECSMIASISGSIIDGKLKTDRPFRSPHHSCSMPAMVGGGANRRVMPGEISLAHNGVLFLDELPEFPRVVIDSLRQPLEEGKINISRANYHVTYPAKFQLIAAMNPCRCGFLGDAERQCNKASRCGTDYQSKISGPFLDRIDIYIEVTTQSIHEITSAKEPEDSKTVAKRIQIAHDIQATRYQNHGIKNNSELHGNLIKEFADPAPEAKLFLNNAAEKMKLSMRGYNRTLKLARSIADLNGEEQINKTHIGEALNYRRHYYNKGT